MSEFRVCSSWISGCPDLGRGDNQGAQIQAEGIIQAAQIQAEEMIQAAQVQAEIPERPQNEPRTSQE